MGNSSAFLSIKTKIFTEDTHLKGHLDASLTAEREKEPDLYGLIDYKNGGKLLEVARKAYMSKSLNKLDDYVKREMQDYFLNDGKEEMVSCFWLRSLKIYMSFIFELKYLDSCGRTYSIPKENEKSPKA